MTDNATKKANEPVPQPAETDLSKEIEQSADRQPGEQVRAVRVFNDCYRCNWWVQDKTPTSFWLTSGTISKSQLLRATMTSAGLHVEQVM